MRAKAVFLTGLLLAAVAAVAQQAAAPADPSILKPPPGARVAIVVFEDLQCPDCARAAPVVEAASRQHNVPVVRHDFPLPQHDWAFEAAVIARYLDTQPGDLGNEFRHWIMARQREVTRAGLRQQAHRFAAEHKTTLPFMVDPRGELAQKVRADVSLGQRIGVRHTPTIYVVSAAKAGAPFVEVVDRAQLSQLIEQMKKEAGAGGGR
jgi:protein-disulfide isomerase